MIASCRCSAVCRLLNKNPTRVDGAVTKREVTTALSNERLLVDWSNGHVI